MISRMKKLLPLPLVLLFLGGCGVTTLQPDDFLFAYRAGVLPTEMAANSYATYDGLKDGYHYAELHGGRPTDLFLGEQVLRPRKVRCLASLLPADFPKGFETRTASSPDLETAEDTRSYVREYLGERRTELQPGSRHDHGF